MAPSYKIAIQTFTILKMSSVTVDEVDAFRAPFFSLNDMMRAIYKEYTETKQLSDNRTMLQLQAITKYGGGPIRELFWLFTGARFPLSEGVKDFLAHLDTLEKLTTERMLAGITSKKYGPNYGCFRELTKQIKQYIEKYSHLVPRETPLPPSMAALCASAHSIGSLRRFCRTRKIDDTTANNLRQRLETHILAKLGWWMTATGKTDNENLSWVAYLEEMQLTKMDPATQTAITDSIEDWLISMRAIEHDYVLLRKISDLQDKTPPGDLAFIGLV